jgi:hypothetical protein
VRAAWTFLVVGACTVQVQSGGGPPGTGDAAADGPAALPDGEVAAADAAAGLDAPAPLKAVAGDDPLEVADTEIWGDFPQENYGAVDHYSVDQEETGLLRLDVSEVPTTATVISATLSVRTLDAVDEGGGTVEIFRLREAFDEGAGDGAVGEANWVLRRPGVPWSAAGALPPSRDAAPLGELRPANVDTVYAIDLPAAMVQEWVADPAQNFGLAFVRGTSTEHIHLRSREAGGASSVLTVIYAP